MARYILVYEIENGFYEEFAQQGMTGETLLEQLKLDIQDQIDDYDSNTC